MLRRQLSEVRLRSEQAGGTTLEETSNLRAYLGFDSDSLTQPDLAACLATAHALSVFFSAFHVKNPPAPVPPPAPKAEAALPVADTAALTREVQRMRSSEEGGPYDTALKLTLHFLQSLDEVVQYPASQHEPASVPVPALPQSLLPGITELSRRQKRKATSSSRSSGEQQVNSSSSYSRLQDASSDLHGGSGEDLGESTSSNSGTQLEHRDRERDHLSLLSPPQTPSSSTYIPTLSEIIGHASVAAALDRSREGAAKLPLDISRADLTSSLPPYYDVWDAETAAGCCLREHAKLAPGEKVPHPKAIPVELRDVKLQAGLADFRGSWQNVANVNMNRLLRDAGVPGIVLTLKNWYFRYTWNEVMEVRQNGAVLQCESIKEGPLWEAALVAQNIEAVPKRKIQYTLVALNSGEKQNMDTPAGTVVAWTKWAPQGSVSCARLICPGTRRRIVLINHFLVHATREEPSEVLLCRSYYLPPDGKYKGSSAFRFFRSHNSHPRSGELGNVHVAAHALNMTGETMAAEQAAALKKGSRGTHLATVVEPSATEDAGIERETTNNKSTDEKETQLEQQESLISNRDGRVAGAGLSANVDIQMGGVVVVGQKRVDTGGSTSSAARAEDTGSARTDAAALLEQRSEESHPLLDCQRSSGLESAASTPQSQSETDLSSRSSGRYSGQESSDSGGADGDNANPHRHGEERRNWRGFEQWQDEEEQINWGERFWTKDPDPTPAGDSAPSASALLKMKTMDEIDVKLAAFVPWSLHDCPPDPDLPLFSGDWCETHNLGSSRLLQSSSVQPFVRASPGFLQMRSLQYSTVEIRGSVVVYNQYTKKTKTSSTSGGQERTAASAGRYAIVGLNNDEKQFFQLPVGRIIGWSKWGPKAPIVAAYEDHDKDRDKDEEGGRGIQNDRKVNLFRMWLSTGIMLDYDHMLVPATFPPLLAARPRRQRNTTGDPFIHHPLTPDEVLLCRRVRIATGPDRGTTWYRFFRRVPKRPLGQEVCDQSGHSPTKENPDMGSSSQDRARDTHNQQLELPGTLLTTTDDNSSMEDAKAQTNNYNRCETPRSVRLIEKGVGNPNLAAGTGSASSSSNFSGLVPGGAAAVTEDAGVARKRSSRTRMGNWLASFSRGFLLGRSRTSSAGSATTPTASTCTPCAHNSRGPCWRMRENFLARPEEDARASARETGRESVISGTASAPAGLQGEQQPQKYVGVLKNMMSKADRANAANSASTPAVVAETVRRALELASSTTEDLQVQPTSSGRLLLNLASAAEAEKEQDHATALGIAKGALVGSPVKPSRAPAVRANVGVNENIVEMEVGADGRVISNPSHHSYCGTTKAAVASPGGRAPLMAGRHANGALDDWPRRRMVFQLSRGDTLVEPGSRDAVSGSSAACQRRCRSVPAAYDRASSSRCTADTPTRPAKNSIVTKDHSPPASRRTSPSPAVLPPRPISALVLEDADDSSESWRLRLAKTANFGDTLFPASSWPLCCPTATIRSTGSVLPFYDVFGTSNLLGGGAAAFPLQKVLSGGVPHVGSAAAAGTGAVAASSSNSTTSSTTSRRRGRATALGPLTLLEMQHQDCLWTLIGIFRVLKREPGIGRTGAATILALTVEYFLQKAMAASFGPVGKSGPVVPESANEARANWAKMLRVFGIPHVVCGMAYIAHCHVVDRAIPLKKWLKLAGNKSSARRFNMCVRNLLILANYRFVYHFNCVSKSSS